MIRDDNLMSHANAMGKLFTQGFLALKDKYSLVGDVRGRGLFLGVEFVTDRVTKAPAATHAQRIVDYMRDQGILMSTDGPLHNVIKVKPPLVLTAEDVRRTLELLDKALDFVSSDSDALS